MFNFQSSIPSVFPTKVCGNLAPAVGVPFAYLGGVGVSAQPCLGAVDVIPQLGGTGVDGQLALAHLLPHPVDGVDAVVTAHTHKPLNTTPSKLRVNPQRNTITEVPFDVIVATSWLKYSGYAAKRMYTPTSHVLQKIVLSGTSKEIEISTKHSY